MQNRFLNYALICMVLSCLGFASNGPANSPEQTKVSIAKFYRPNHPTYPETSRLIKLMKEDKTLQLEEWGGITLPGGGAKASLMMSIAGDTAPDIGEAWFHIIQSEIENGFLYPLNEWIGEDTNGNGIIDDEEAKWEPWKKIPPLWRRVAMRDGKVYGIPQASKNYMGVIFRTDLVRAAGLNPNNPPETWDEFKVWLHKLSITKNGNQQKGICLTPWGWTFLPWIQAAGGTPLTQYRISPETGERVYFSPEETNFIAPNGEDLNGVESFWKANFDSPETIEAAQLYHDIIWQKWIRHPKTGETILLEKADIAAGKVTFKEEEISFSKDDIITGTGYPQTGQRGEGAFDYLSTGEVAMVTTMITDLNGIGQRVGINPDLLSWFPFPAGPGPNGVQSVQIQNHYAVMYEGVGRRPKHERDKVWEAITALTDQEVADNSVRYNVLSGLARFSNPKDLERLGYEEYLKDIPEKIQENYKNLDNGKVQVATEPYLGFWFTVDVAVNKECLGLILSKKGEDFDFKQGLRDVNAKANGGMMFKMTSDDLDKYRPTARIVFIFVVILTLILVFKFIKANMKKTGKDSLGGAGSTSNVYNKWLAWGMVVPALSLIALWSYYPLFRGMVMAFQDYKITGESPYVGLDNFIALCLDKSFWMSIVRTVYFVFLTMALSFTTPILLAVLLTDVPRFKIFLRTLYFLPQMTSGLVIALLWEMMYEPTPQGFFNQIITFMNKLPFVDIGTQVWLEDPALAMICVVMPTVWATMGIQSLIYLAALGSIPTDMYEAADIDGAGIWHKFTKITLPSILPLIIINFVGAFIGTFQNMGNIFLMTFGGPAEHTTVVALKIWVEAYNNLRFSYATAMAWILGSLLIGFTYFQIQFLSKIEYKKAK